MVIPVALKLSVPRFYIVPIRIEGFMILDLTFLDFTVERFGTIVSQWLLEC